MVAVAVIGANLGDEGKGLVVDALVRHLGAQDCLVVRHNGGAQAAHTVVDGGRRHAFGHIGSGTFAGAATHLSEFFVHNPLLLLKELSAIGEVPALSADAFGLVTTPCDMVINQALTHGHGTCGVGFGETIERSRAGYQLRVATLSDDDAVIKALRVIDSGWAPQRCHAAGLDYATVFGPLDMSGMEIQFLDAVAAFRQRVAIVNDRKAVSERRHVVYEGAQGLLLDQTRGWFPHVTRSNTGLKNIQRADLNLDHAIYVTRWYMTRHGAGPLPDELLRLPHHKVTDETNIENRHQGRLRFGHLNTETLVDRVELDSISTRASLAVTCLDQNDGQIEWRGEENNLVPGTTDEFVDSLRRRLQVTVSSRGPSADDVTIGDFL
jgi:adenylosuccinate synthase